MALLSFPSSPTNGQTYPTSPLVGQNQYEWSAAEQTWRLLGPATAVTPGTYGDATNVGQFTVDAQGRLTSAVNVPISATTPDLQDVTTQGAVTTDTIDVGGLVAAGLTYPNVDGASGDYLTTDGAGNLSFAALPVEDLQSVTDNGATTTNTIDVAGLVSAGLTYPLIDGTADQVVSTDGAGNLGWLSTLKVVTAPTASTDAGALGEVAVAAGFFYFFDGTQWLQVAGSTF
jgi:hypothetical protein